MGAFAILILWADAPDAIGPSFTVIGGNPRFYVKGNS